MRQSLSAQSLPLPLLAEFAEKYQGPPAEPEALRRLERILTLARGAESAARHLAREWAIGDSLDFFRALVEVLKQPPGNVDLARLQSLVSAEALVAGLLEPDCYLERDARELVRKCEPWALNLDLHIARHAFGDDAGAPKPVSSLMAQRALGMLNALSPGERILPFLSRACRLGDSRIHSQVARLAGRYRARGLLVRLLEDGNPRVRANAVESLAGARHLADRQELLWRATHDEHHRVAVNALVALARLGDPEALDRLEGLATHPAPQFRAAAAWGMGELADLRFQRTLTELYRDEASGVRRNALRALVRLRKGSAERPTNGKS